LVTPEYKSALDSHAERKYSMHKASDSIYRLFNIDAAAATAAAGILSINNAV
jgi:hypothetical protein